MICRYTYHFQKHLFLIMAAIFITEWDCCKYFRLATLQWPSKPCFFFKFNLGKITIIFTGNICYNNPLNFHLKCINFCRFKKFLLLVMATILDGRWDCFDNLTWVHSRIMLVLWFKVNNKTPPDNNNNSHGLRLSELKTIKKKSRLVAHFKIYINLQHCSY